MHLFCIVSPHATLSSFEDCNYPSTRVTPLSASKAPDRTTDRTPVRAPRAIIGLSPMSNDMRRQNTSLQHPYTSQRPLLPRDHSTMSVICYEEHPRSDNGLPTDHSIGSGISTALVPSSFGPHTEHGQRMQRSASSVHSQRSASMDSAFGRHHESNPRFASYGRRSVGQLSNDREGLEGSKRNRDSISSRNDYNLNFDGRQCMDTAGPEPQRDSTRQRRLVSSDTTAAGQTVTSTYTSTYTKSKTGAAFTGSAPS